MRNRKLIEIASEFLAACNMELQTNPSFSGRFQNAMTDDELSSYVMQSFDLQLTQCESFIGLRNEQDTESQKRIELADMYARIALKVYKADEIRSITGLSAVEEGLRKEVEKAGAPSLARALST